MRKAVLCVLAPLLSGCLALSQAPPAAVGWPAYGGDPGGQRHSDAAQINRGNVARLRTAWEFHTGALRTDNLSRDEAAFEATPILHNDALFFSTPFDQVIALDAASGRPLWRFDPSLRRDLSAGVYTSRGVAFWGSDQPLVKPFTCGQRVFVATLDARLIALDAATGKPCPDFGHGGTVNLRTGVPTQTSYPYQEFGVSSAPTVVGDVVVVGSAVADGQEVDVEPGLVRGYDTRSGRQVWSWDPMPWAAGQTPRTGAGNTWSTISADPVHHLIFLPTGSPSPDFYGGLRPGDDRDANSVVALDADTGRKIWAFQVVHHDLWDYDVAAQPLLFDGKGGVPAIAITTKMGMIFILNRLTGVPIYPVEERPVPQSDVPGETSSPTQPFSSLPPLSPLNLQPADLRDRTRADAEVCMAKLAALRNDGIFTPPSLRGSLLYPGSLGGVNWGSPAFDPETGVLYANSNHHAFSTRLIPRWRFELSGQLNSWENWAYAAGSLLLLLCLVRRDLNPGRPAIGAAIALGIIGGYLGWHRAHSRQHFGREIAEQRKAPFAAERAPIEDEHGLPCTPVPWGRLTAIDLKTGKHAWDVPLGSMLPGADTGSLNLGGPIVTAGGLVFAAAGREPLLRAYDKGTGQVLWAGKLPRPAQATPMTYTAGGKQFVVVAAGGHGGFGTPQGDSLIAFALPSEYTRQVDPGSPASEIAHSASNTP